MNNMTPKTRTRGQASVRDLRPRFPNPFEDEGVDVMPPAPLRPSMPVRPVMAPAVDAAALQSVQWPSAPPAPVPTPPDVDPELAIKFAPILSHLATLPAYQQSSVMPFLLRENDPRIGVLHRKSRADLYVRMTAGGEAFDEAEAFMLDRSIAETELSLQRVDIELVEITNDHAGFVNDLTWIERLEALRDRYVNRLVSLIRLRRLLRSPSPVNIRSNVTVQNAATNQQVQVNVGSGTPPPVDGGTKSP